MSTKIAVAVLLSLLLAFIISATSAMLTFLIVNNDKRSELEVMRQEYRSLILTERRDGETQINRMREQLATDSFVYNKRMQMMQEEIDILKKKQQ